MAFPGSSDVDLILALQDGAARGGEWGAFLARLAGLTSARFAAMIIRMPGSGKIVDIVTALPSGSVPSADAAALAIILTERMRPERIYAENELAELTEAQSGALFADALAALNVISVNAIRVAVPTFTIAVGIFGSRRFDAADGGVLRRLYPYLHLGARTATRIWHERLHVTMTVDLARRSGLGWFLLDRAGTVLDSWTATPAVSRSIRVLPGAHGDRIALANRGAEPALAAILAGVDGTTAPRVRALWVAHDPPLHLRIAPVPPEWVDDPREPAALATLHGELQLGRDVEGLLGELFGLLPSEARLAAAIGRGDRLIDAAARLGLTVETARNYSKRIFVKTGTQGQADLVRLILANGLAELGEADPADG